MFSEQSLLGLIATKLGTKNVVHICEENNHIRDYISSRAIANYLQDRLSLHSADWLPPPPTSAGWPPSSPILEAAACVSDNTVAPHPLWEYPAIALGEATLIAELDITTTEVPSYNIEFSGECLVTDRSKVSDELNE